jgi:hypothetical protein
LGNASRFDAPEPTMGNIKWLVGALYPETMWGGIISKNRE